MDGHTALNEVFARGGKGAVKIICSDCGQVYVRVESADVEPKAEKEAEVWEDPDAKIYVWVDTKAVPGQVKTNSSEITIRNLAWHYPEYIYFYHVGELDEG
jgi:hypothetical protein